MVCDSTSYDIDPIAAAFAVAYGNSSRGSVLEDRRGVHIVEVVDIMDLSLVCLPRCDGLVAGPPCPPFSCMGPQAVWRDDRAAVYIRVVDWIVWLSRRDKRFRFFHPGKCLGYV